MFTVNSARGVLDISELSRFEKATMLISSDYSCLNEELTSQKRSQSQPSKACLKREGSDQPKLSG